MEQSLNQRWHNGEVTLGAWCMIPDALTAEILAKCGYDWVLVDMQHGCMDYETAVGMIRAIDLAGITPLVRVTSNDSGMIGRLLDAGAMGVVVPMINTVEDAKRVVDACLYPPKGRRSLGPIRVGVRDGMGYFPTANDRIAVIPMIETADALAAVEEIAHVPGVSALFMGPFDLSLALGLPPGDNDGEKIFDDAVKKINDASKKAGIATAVLSTAELAPLRAKQGFQMISVITDSAAIMASGRAAVAKAKDTIEQT